MFLGQSLSTIHGFDGAINSQRGAKETGKNEDMIDERNYTHNPSSCETKALLNNSGMNGSINRLFISISAVQIYDISCIYLKLIKLICMKNKYFEAYIVKKRPL